MTSALDFKDRVDPSVLVLRRRRAIDSSDLPLPNMLLIQNLFYTLYMFVLPQKNTTIFVSRNITSILGIDVFTKEARYSCQKSFAISPDCVK